MKVNIKFITAFFIVTLLHLNYSIVKSQNTLTGIVKGKLVDQNTKQPIYGAVVSIKDNNSFSTTSDSLGNFEILNVPEGNYSLVFFMIGYQEKTLNDVIVSRNKTYYAEIELLEETSTIGEVTITAKRNHENNPMTPVSSYSFSREEIFRNPGAQGDIFRAIGILPGVSSSGGQFSAIAVRGQGTRDNVYIVDDIPMFEVTHLEGDYGGFNDPNGGRFSIFAPRIIDNAQFQGGGFAAQYGRKSASYLGLGIKEGNKETPSLSGQFDLLGATLIYDGPSGIHKNTSIFASGRYQNFRVVQKMVGLENLGSPVYSDYIIKSTTQLNEKNKLSIVAMYNPEDFERNVDHVKLSDKIESTDIGTFTVNKALIGVNLRTLTSHNSYWKNVVYYRSMLRDAALGGTYPVGNPDGLILDDREIRFKDNLRSVKNSQKELGLRSIFTKTYKNLKIITGIDLANINLDYNRQLHQTDTIYTFSSNEIRVSPFPNYLVLPPVYFNSSFNKSAINFSAYVDFSFQLLKKITLNPGVRYDYTGYSKQNTIAPRLSGSIQLNEKNTFNFATGIYYQDPLLTDIADQPKGNLLKCEKTIQYILGYKNYFTEDLKLVVEVWRKTFNQLVVRPNRSEAFLNNNGSGYAYGADINVTKRLSQNYYGQVGYSYMQSKRNNNDGSGEYNFSFSQPHIFSILGSYKPSSKWVFSTKYRFATGRPKDEYMIHNNIFSDSSFLRSSMEITRINGGRLNNFMSWDIRIDYNTHLNKIASTIFIDVVNVLNRQNQSSELFQPITGKTYYDGLAIFPTFGIRLEL